MTPLEGAANVLASHTPMLTAHGVIVGCECGIEAGDQHYDWDSWRHHAADMLAAAGVVMGVQEWGVRRGWVDVYDSRAAAQDFAEFIRGVLPDDEATIVSRFTGATAWTAEEGL